MSRNRIYFIALCLLICILFVADLMLGSFTIPASEAVSALLGRGGDQQSTLLMLNFRLPKAVVAVLVGIALSCSGLQMQTLFRNPLAGPYVLGISSGASLGVSIFLLGVPLVGVTFASEFVRNMGIVGAAWVGGAMILLIIMAVSVRIKDIMTILILGMMFGSAATAFVEILQYLSPETALKSFVIWTMGSLGGVSQSQLWVMAVVITIGMVISILLIKPLNLLLLGENYARTMGLNVKRSRALIFISTVLLAGTVTAFCGPIGFIGIAVPHLARMIFANADHKVLMPASMLLGGCVMLLCDIIAQLPGYDMVLPINTVTALLGIPIVVFVIVRNRRFF